MATAAPYFTLLYAAHRFSGEPVTQDDESLKVGWFSPARLPPVMPVMARTLDAYARHKKTGRFQMIWWERRLASRKPDPRSSAHPPLRRAISTRAHSTGAEADVTRLSAGPTG